MTAEIKVVEEIALGIPGWEIDGYVLKPVGRPDRASCMEMGARLKAGSEMFQFFVGDWANAVHDVHGRGAMRDLAAAIGLNPDSVHQYAYTARQYDSLSRLKVVDSHPELSFEHLRAVQDQPAADKLLEMADRESMSVKQLRTYVREHTEPEPEPERTAPDAGQEYFSWIRSPIVEAASIGWKNISAAIKAMMARPNPDKGAAHQVLKQWRGYMVKMIEDIDKELGNG